MVLYLVSDISSILTQNTYKHLTYFAKPGLDDPVIVHTRGFALNWDTTSWILAYAVTNSVGANVTDSSISPLAGTTPNKSIKDKLHQKVYRCENKYHVSHATGLMIYETIFCYICANEFEKLAEIFILFVN